MEVAALGLRVESVSVEKASADLDRLTGAAARAERSAGGLSKGSDAAARAMHGMHAASSRSNSSLASLAMMAARAGAVLGAAFSVRALVQYADAWQGLENRLRLVTNGSAELARATNDVYAIAQRTSQEIDTVAQVYQRFAQNADTLGLSQARVAAITETVSKAVAVSGGTAEGAQAALMQFGQALASGVLRGEEFNSVMEQAPGLAQALAEGLGVPVGALREMAAEGEITADKIVNALEKASTFVSDQFGTRIRTVDQSMTELTNSVTRFVGQAASATGVTRDMADAISGLARWVDSLSGSIDTLVRETDAVRAVYALLSTEIGDFYDNYLAKATDTNASVATSFEQSFLQTAKELDTLVEVFTGTLGGLDALFLAIATNIVNSFANAFNETLRDLSQFVNNSIDMLNPLIEALGGEALQPVSWGNEPTRAMLGLAAAYEDGYEASKVMLGAHQALVDEIGNRAIWRAAAAGMEEYAEGEEKAAKATGGFTKATKDKKKALTEAEKAQRAFEQERSRAIDAQITEIAAITEKAIALEDENRLYGQAKSAIDALVIARLEEKAALLSGFGGSKQQIELINTEIAARKRLLEATAQNEVLEANAKAAEEATKDWKKMTEQVGQSLTDAIFAGGKSGKQLVEDLFRTMVLRPVIQPAMQMGMNMLGQALGIPGAPGVKNGASFDLSSLLGGGNISSSISNFADVAGFKLYSAGLEKVGGALVENSAAIGKFANSAGQVFGYGKAIYDVTQGQYGSAIGTAIGTYILPGIGTAIGSMLGGMVDGMFGQPEARYGGTYTYRPGQGTERPGWAAGDAGPQAMQFADSLLSSAAGAVERAFAAAGSDVILKAFEASFESSEKGRGGTHSGGTLVIDGHEISFGTSKKGQGYGGTNGTLEEMMKAAEVDTWQTVIQAWQAAIDVFPAMMQDMIRGVDADALGLEAAQALAQQFVAMIEQINALSAALGALPFVPAIAQTFEFAAALAQAAGGAENAATLLNGYYQNYYSEAERAGHLTGQLTERFAALGYTLPQTREEFRALVQANMALGEAGARTVASLLGLGEGLNTLITYTDQAAQATRQAAQKALDDAQQAAYAAALAARQAAEQRASSAMSILTNAVNREKAALQKAFDAVAEGLNTAIGASQTTLQSLQSLASSLKSTLRTMSGQFDPVMNRTSAQAQIAQALATAQRTGVMPNVEDLQNALQVVAQPSQGMFSSFEEYQLDFLRTANDIAQLNQLTGDQISMEERTLNMLRDQLDTETEQFEQEMARYDTIIETMQQHLDVAMGNTLAVMSVEQAVLNMTSALAVLKATPVPSAPSAPEKGGYINDLYRDLFGRDAEQAGIDYWTGRVESGMSVGDLERAIREAARNEDKTKLLRGYAVGTSYVPYDMPANIHQGEIIIDRRSSDILRQYGIGVQPNSRGSDEETRLLREEVRSLRLMMQTMLNEIERNTYETARTNRQMTEEPSPMTVTNVVSTVAAVPGK